MESILDYAHPTARVKGSQITALDRGAPRARHRGSRGILGHAPRVEGCQTTSQERGSPSPELVWTPGNCGHHRSPGFFSV